MEVSEVFWTYLRGALRGTALKSPQLIWKIFPHIYGDVIVDIIVPHSEDVGGSVGVISFRGRSEVREIVGAVTQT